VARVQFRLPDGRSQTTQFDAGEPLAVLYAYVREQMTHPFGRNFSLSTTFPSRVLDREDRERTTLREAGLAPSATVLIMPAASTAVSAASEGGFMGLVWLMLTPLVLAWNFLSALVASFGHSPNPNNRAETQPPAAAGGESTSQNARARAAAR
jgi:Na+-transporting methylmalonyl-CoA/oxaloacetate decarboxylase gamma subunit